METNMHVMVKGNMTAQSQNGTIRLPPEAIQTTQVIEFLDKLFDSVNGHGYDSKGKRLRSCVTDNSEHVQFWKESIKIFKTMNYIDRNGVLTNPPSIKNWITTLEGLIELNKELRSVGFTNWAPRTFNQDSLENFFGQIRQRGVRFTNPTVAAFTPFYTSLLVNNFSKDHSVGSNCENDETNILLSLHEFVMQDVQNFDKPPPSSSDIQVPKDLKNLKILELMVLHYVSGFISKKILPRIRNCETCKTNILADQNEMKGVVEQEEEIEDVDEWEEEENYEWETLDAPEEKGMQQ